MHSQLFLFFWCEHKLFLVLNKFQRFFPLLLLGVSFFLFGGFLAHMHWVSMPGTSEGDPLCISRTRPPCTLSSVIFGSMTTCWLSLSGFLNLSSSLSQTARLHLVSPPAPQPGNSIQAVSWDILFAFPLSRITVLWLPDVNVWKPLFRICVQFFSHFI